MRKNSYDKIETRDENKKKLLKEYYKYQMSLIKKNGFKTYQEYQTHIAKQNGFASYTEYQKYTAGKRQGRKKNKILSSIIKIKLIELDRSQTWLACQIEMNSGTVSRYISGTLFPNRDALIKISNVLELSKKTLEELIAEDMCKKLIT